MVKKLKDIYLKYKEGINYLFFGGLATIVSFGTYYISAQVLNIDEVISNGISWVFAVIFAYITNKLFVFESKKSGRNDILKEFLSFVGFRAFTGAIIDIGLFALMVKVLDINDLISKFVTQVLIVIINYILSKLIIFKKIDKED